MHVEQYEKSKNQQIYSDCIFASFGSKEFNALFAYIFEKIYNNPLARASRHRFINLNGGIKSCYLRVEIKSFNVQRRIIELKTNLC